MASSPLKPHSFLIRYNISGGRMNKKDVQMILVVRGPLAIAFNDYIVDPVSGKKILDDPIEVEVNNIILEWIQLGKLKEFNQPEEQAKG